MSFTTDGSINVEIIGTAVTAAKFAPAPALDVWLQIKSEDGASDWWRGEISTNYGRGNYADRTQAQITADSLASIGYQHGADLAQLNSLIGTSTQAFVKRNEKDGRVYYNVTGIGNGSGNGPDIALGAAEIQQRMGQLFSVQHPPQQAPQQSPPSAPATPGNPFA